MPKPVALPDREMDVEMQATAVEVRAAAANDLPSHTQSMSLSRRYLSLPQELAGCSLPPKVAGRRFGSVTLCVAHILESAVSARALPRVSLVRVRWWGEDRPGSLFRPSVLSDSGRAAETTEETATAPQRAIAMRYPVCVPPEHLLEYFQDMKQLGMDVIDRSTRRKYGHCSVSLMVDATGQGLLTAEQKLAALQRDNALCEIRASEAGETAGDEEGGEVLGYLAITLEVQWTSPEVHSHELLQPRAIMVQAKPPVERLTKDDEEVSGYPAVAKQPAPMDGEADSANVRTVQEPPLPVIGAEAVSDEDAGRRDDLSLASSLSSPAAKEDWAGFFQGEGDRFPSPFAVGSTAMAVNREQAQKNSTPNKKRRQETQERHDRGGDFLRIRELLEKGKALQRSMERAVGDGGNGGYELDDLKYAGVEGNQLVVGNAVEADGAMKEVRQALMLAPYEELTAATTDGVENASTWQQMLEETAPSGQCTTVKRKNCPSMAADAGPELPKRVDSGSVVAFRDGIDRLKLTFESLELERDFVDDQLRQLRDSSSVSSRFSPIQIRASHADVSSLLWPQHKLLRPADSQPSEVAAFSVTTSLRKRQWQLDCSHVVSLSNSPPKGDILQGDLASLRGPESPTRSKKQLQFFVRCENQNDIKRSKKRHKQGLFHRPTKCLLLSGAIDTAALFSMASRPDEAWTTTVPLLFSGDEGVRNPQESLGDPQQRGLKAQPKRKKKAVNVGHMTVKFVFFASAKGGDSSNEEMVEDSVKDDNGSDMLVSSIGSRLEERDQYHEGASGQDQVRQIPFGASPFQRFLESEVHRTDSPDIVQEKRNSESRNREPLQFAVMLERVTGVKLSASTDSDNRPSFDLRQQSFDSVAADTNETAEVRNLSLHYAVPSHFSRKGSGDVLGSKTFERTVRRKLAASRWLGFQSLLWANFNGHVNIFPSSFPVDADKYFENGFLIVEVWLVNAKGESDTLLGLSKIPLDAFSQLLREAKMQAFCEQTLPFTGVDGSFPIEDPFSGRLAGLLRARAFIGTAEQILALTTTVRAITTFQSVVRGVLCRGRLRKRSIETSVRASSGDVALPARSTVSLGYHGPDLDESKSDAPSAAPTASTRMWDAEPSAELEEHPASVDHSDTYESGLMSADASTAIESFSPLHKIRFDIRESWRTTRRQGTAKETRSATDEQLQVDQGKILGCEIQGQLVLVDNSTTTSGELASGIPFALWWDAADRNLNSFFVHSFHGKRGGDTFGKSYAGAALLPSVGPRSQVLFALRMENGFFGTQSRDTVMGEARLKLLPVLGESRTLKTFGEGENTTSDESRAQEERCVEVDVPITWDAWGRDGSGKSSANRLNNQRLPSSIPLKISYRVSAYPEDWSPHQVQEASSTPPSQLSEEESVYEPHRREMKTGAISTTKRLLPASITLSFNLLTLTDFKYALHEKQRQLLDESAETADLTSQHLDEVLRTSPHTLSVVLGVKICLGTELHELEEAEDKEQRRRSDDMGAASSLFTESGRWYKQWWSPHIAMDAHSSHSESSGEELQLEQLVMETRLVVHPEVMDSMQEECAEITVALWCDSCVAPHEIGCAVVPVAAVLFRPSGVEGAFPVRVGEVATGRLRVHVYLDHGRSGASQAAQSIASGAKQDLFDMRSLQLAPDADGAPSLPTLLSPTSPEEIASPRTIHKVPLHSIQVNVQEVRNLVMAGEPNLPSTSAAPPNMFALLSLVNNEAEAGVPELCTEGANTLSPGRDYCQVIRVDITRWKGVSVDVSLWLYGNHRPEDSSSSLTMQRLRNPSENDMFIGKARIDLGLLDNGWREIDGWYHLIDGRQLNRGQVKVRVVLVTGGRSEMTPTAASIDNTQGRCSSLVDDNQFAKLAGDSSLSEKFQPQETSSEFVEPTVHHASMEVKKSVEDFTAECDDTENNAGNANEQTNAEDICPSRQKKEEGSDRVVGNMSPTIPAKETKHPSSEPFPREGDARAEDNETTILNAEGGKSGIEIEIETEGAKASRSAGEQASPFADRVSSLDIGDRDAEIGSSSSEDIGLEIDVGAYKPITLTSLGIEELELSPFTDAALSPPQYDQEQNGSEASVPDAGSFGLTSPYEENKDGDGKNGHEEANVMDERDLWCEHEAQEEGTGGSQGCVEAAADPVVVQGGADDVAAAEDSELDSFLSAENRTTGHISDGDENEADNLASRMESGDGVDGEVEAARVDPGSGVEICASAQPEPVDKSGDACGDTKDVSLKEDANEVPASEDERGGTIGEQEINVTAPETIEEADSNEVTTEPSKEAGSVDEAELFEVAVKTEKVEVAKQDGSFDEGELTKIPDAAKEEGTSTEVDSTNEFRPSAEARIGRTTYEPGLDTLSFIGEGEQEERERSSGIDADPVSCMDKAVQVDPSELEICSGDLPHHSPDVATTTSGMNHGFGDGLNTAGTAEHACSPMEKIDVGCDPMDVSLSTDESVLTEGGGGHVRKASESFVTVEADIPGWVENDVTDAMTKPGGASFAGSHSHLGMPAAPSPTQSISLESKKLDLVYQLLREIQASWVASAANSRISLQARSNSDGIREPGEKALYDDGTANNDERGETDLIDECASDANFPPRPADSTILETPASASYVSHEDTTGLEQPVNSRKETAAVSTGMEQFVPSADSLSTMGRPVSKTLRFTIDDAFQDPGSLHDEAGNREIRASAQPMTADVHLPPFNARSETKRPVWQWKREESNQMSSQRHALSLYDSETERIARIMQGSMEYWLKDDASSGWEDETSDKDDSDGDDGYF